VNRILIAVTAFNSPWTLREQLRLLHENLLDEHRVFVFDNSDHDLKPEVETLCGAAGATYMHVGKRREHIDALNRASGCFRTLDQPGGNFLGETGDGVTHLMWLDHDVYLTALLRLCPLIDQGGFLAIRQRHPATGVHYAWPGFLAVSRTWLNGRALDFSGIRGEEKRDDGDTGSMTYPIFDVADWSALPPVEHGYRQLREPDDIGLQSWAYEFFRFGDTPEWRHATNVSRWLAVPDPEERERLVREMVEAL
jgi:hypothetical protein